MSLDETEAVAGTGYIHREVSMPISTKYFCLQISRCVNGGYTVSTVNVPTVITLFACSTLDEALSFVRDNIMENARAPAPEPPKEWRAVGARSEFAKAAMRFMAQRNPSFDRLTKKRTRRTKSIRARKVK